MKHFSTRPRRRFSADERAKFVALYRQSGLKQSAFARQHGIKPGTLHQWLSRGKADAACAGPGFQELMAPLTASPWAAEIRLSPQITIQLGSEATGQLLNQLLGSLRRPC